MITNDRQYQTSKAQLENFQRAIAEAKSRKIAYKIDPRTALAMIAGLEGKEADLRAEIERYEALRDGQAKDL